MYVSGDRCDRELAGFETVDFVEERQVGGPGYRRTTPRSETFGPEGKQALRWFRWGGGWLTGARIVPKSCCCFFSVDLVSKIFTSRGVKNIYICCLPWRVPSLSLLVFYRGSFAAKIETEVNKWRLVHSFSERFLPPPQMFTLTHPTRPRVVIATATSAESPSERIFFRGESRGLPGVQAHLALGHSTNFSPRQK